MKKKLTNNIGLKILSIILAAILWLVITNVDDPKATKSFTNVPVEVLNENVIASLDKVYDITEGETIDFTVEARRSIRDKLTVSDFKVTADFKELSIVDSVPIKITCPRYGDEVVVVDGKNQNMMVSLEDIKDETFKVDVIQKGEAAQGYYIGETKASPNIIQVSGPKGRVDRIAEVVVNVDVSGATESFKTNATPKVLDADGNEIDASKLTFNYDTVDINVSVYNTKKINLQITTTGEPSYGYQMTNIEYEPKEIIVAGDDEALKSIMYLSIPVSIFGAKENIEKEINLQDELKDGLVIVGEDKTAVINITIEKLVSKELTIWPGDIQTKNKPENLNLTYNMTGPILVKVMGLSKDIDELTRMDLHPYIDLTGYGAGTYSLAFALEKSDPAVLVDSPTVNFILTKETGPD